MTTQGQDNSLTFFQGQSYPNFQTSFPKKQNTRLFEAKFHTEQHHEMLVRRCVQIMPYPMPAPSEEV